MTLCVAQVTNISDAENIVAELAVALSSQRVYGVHHQRCQEAMRRLTKLLRQSLTAGPTLRFQASDGLIAFDGIPLSNNNRLAQLSSLMEDRQCAGLEFKRDTSTRDIEQLLTWLCDRRADAVLPAECSITILERDDNESEDEESDELQQYAARFPEFRVPLRLYKTAAESMRRSMARARRGEQLEIDELTDLAHYVADEIFSGANGLLGPIQLVRMDSYTFQHSLNVFLIATTLLRPFARDVRELATLAQAAMLHDIGKSRIPKEILHKTTKLNDEELALMQQHTRHGAEILMEHKNISPVAIEVAYCHHMRDGGFGYPQPDLPFKPGPVTRIVQVCDMFEALTAPRPYKSGMPVPEAIQVIATTPGMAEREPALSLLMWHLTHTPPGSHVVLSTGEKATVVTPRPDKPRSPVVRVFTDKDGEPIDEPRLTDLGETGSVVKEVILRPGAVGLSS